MSIEVIGAIFAGLIGGSFLSVVVERWYSKSGMLLGRSQCPNCRHVLSWYDLIPIFSWILLCGRCRYCKETIHWQYPLLELGTAATFGIFVFRWGIPTGWHILDVVTLFILLGLFFFDLRWFILPDVFTVGLSVLLLARLLFDSSRELQGPLLAAVLLAAFFLVLYSVTRGTAVGLGDAKLGFLVGLIFGFPEAVVVTVVAIWIGALFGVILTLSGRATRKTPLPFGSFWSAVALCGLLRPELLSIATSWLSLR